MKSRSALLFAVLFWIGETPAAEPHWAFQPPKAVPPPAAGDSRWNANPIDRFLAAEHAKRKLTPSGPADRATLLRRVYIDLVGLPPTRAELQAFLTDRSPDAYEKVVDHLLASPQYGERWGRHWMDVWRYSDWYGRRSVPDVLNSYAQVWRWRDWIVRSINEDRGYDRMILEMLAADEVCPEDDANLVATGFVVRNFFRWNYNNWMRDNVEHTAKAFLGLTLNCCHCHDHKYDPITQEEYFRFRAIFEPIEIRHDRWPGEPDPGPYEKYVYTKSYPPIKSGLVRVFDEKPDAPTFFYTGGDERNKVKDRPPVPPGVPKSLGGERYRVEPVNLPPSVWYPGLKPFVRADERGKRRQAIASAEAEIGTIEARMSVPKVTTLARSASEFVTTLVADVHALTLGRAKLAAARSDLAALEARIAADDIIHLGAKGDAKAASEAASKAERQHQLDLAVVAQLEKPSPANAAKVDSARKALATVSTKYTPLSPIYPKTSSGRRAALARWIASPHNPLTARVAVNHVWGWHFGRPLVETTANFGKSGKRPSHPELLDWLAVELVKHGWKFKPLHRTIVTSQAYRMDSRGDAGTGSDPDNIYVWKFPTQRMEAEVVRDSMLCVAGELDATMGGIEIPQEQGMTGKRRSLYFAHHGETRMPFLDLFDAANPCDAYRRTTSVLPQQALAMSNSELALRLSRVLARKLAPPSTSDPDFVRAAFETMLNRSPREAETTASVAFLERQRSLFEKNKAALTAAGPDGPSAEPAQRARENLVHALFNHTDFVTVR